MHTGGHVTHGQQIHPRNFAKLKLFSTVHLELVFMFGVWFATSMIITTTMMMVIFFTVKETPIWAWAAYCFLLTSTGTEPTKTKTKT